MKKNVANLVLKLSPIGWILLLISGIFYLMNIPGTEYLAVSAGVVFIFRQVLILIHDSPREEIDLSLIYPNVSGLQDEVIEETKT